ncbi:MAG: CbiX/SirB N-terminal domain-containing protein [Planctomycetaceae bacterium]|jgi:sirohydrochlorin ferrochelatase|nr:CbiX/SirB N-terminal domain-containing protein [Planctomycetaceae bacterium]
MRRVFTTLLTALAIFTVLTVSAAAQTAGKPGLLILTHGAPSPNWQESIKKLGERVSALNEKEKTFRAVTAANMEFAKPDTAAGIETLEKAGCDRIIVVPAFICPTSHTHFDVPASLGLYSSPSTRKTLKEENARAAVPHVPVTVTQTISEGDVLDKYVRDEVAALSTNPEEEAVLLISHGDEDHAGLIEPTMRRLLAQACGSKGITKGTWAFCEVGQSYMWSVVPVIKQLAESRKRVLVVGFYLVSSAKTIDRAGTSMGRRGGGGPGGPGGQEGGERKSPLDGIDVKFSERGVIEHPDTPNWVLQSAKEALQ